MQNICVFCSSSDSIAPTYYDVAIELGTLIAEYSWTLIYGGAGVGLMGKLARSVHKNGSKVVGVIPKSLHKKGITYEDADEIILTKDLSARKEVMQLHSDAFVALPGGFGTLDEISEILTLKQLQIHNKAVVFINTNGFYDHLVSLFEHIYNEHFAKFDYRQLYYVAPDAASAVSYIVNYQPLLLPSKW